MLERALISQLTSLLTNKNTLENVHTWPHVKKIRSLEEKAKKKTKTKTNKNNYNKQNVEFRYSKHAEMSSLNRVAFTRRISSLVQLIFVDWLLI